MPTPDPTRPPPPPAWRAFARAPLVPVAIAAIVGLCVDRYLTPPFGGELLAGAAAGIAWPLVRGGRFLLTLIAVAAVAAAYHHTHRHTFPADDIGQYAGPTPVVVSVRGIIDESPVIRKRSATELFGPPLRLDRGSTVLSATSIRIDGWQPASGRLRLSVERLAGESEFPLLAGIRVGDEVEVVGLLSRSSPPGNPGELDYADWSRDRRIRAELRVTKSADGLTRLAAGNWTVAGVIARIQAAGAKPFDDHLPPDQAGLARALLLGDTAATDREEWDAFARTGVVHVLVISGQHLVILAGVVWWIARLADIRRRRAAWLVMAVVIAYAIITGMRPSAVRAAVMVCITTGAMLMNRPLRPANGFAAAVLAVIALDPTDPFTIGCQASFLAVFVLFWGVGHWAISDPDPLDRLERELQPLWRPFLHELGRMILFAFAANLVITVALAPLLAARTNVIPPVSVLVGPPLVLLTTLALVTGLAAVAVGVVVPPAGEPLVAVTGKLLAACDWLVHRADALPGSSVYLPGPPMWWLIGFYLLVGFVVLMDARGRRRAGIVLAAWTLVGLVPFPAGRGDELRVTVLAVGHGSCAVLETPDGRVLVSDAGSTFGSDAVRRSIAPYLWSRGIRRIDELFVSHADADHFNGIVELMRRFPVGRLTLTPSFRDKPTADVAAVLLAADRAGVPVRTVSAGDRFAAGNVAFEVLHPPAEGPPGTENERSLVLRVTHAGHTFLLTGDLEKKGTAALLSLPSERVDVLFAPHHGSRAAFPPGLTEWAKPVFVVISRANRDPGIAATDVPGATVWDTPTAGAVTIRSHPSGLTAEAFRTGERVVVRRR